MTKKVLLFDNATSYTSRSHLLAEEGYHVDMVYDTDACLQRLGAQTYDVIIIQESREAESWQLCAEIRRLCHLPLIVINTNASTDTCINTLKAGADYFIRKPFGPLEFSARVHSLLRRTSINQPAPIGS